MNDRCLQTLSAALQQALSEPALKTVRKKEIVAMPLNVPKPEEIEIKVIEKISKISRSVSRHSVKSIMKHVTKKPRAEKIEKPEKIEPISLPVPIAKTKSKTEKSETDSLVPPSPEISISSDKDSLSSDKDSLKEIPAAIGSTNGSTSGYGSETVGSEGYVSEEDRIKLKTPETSLKVLDIRDDDTHCARCHKTFDPLSASNAEKRCLLPHPTKMVIPIRRDLDGTHFVCLCCRTEFKLPKMTFYEAGVNSMLTGYCFIGQHTSDEKEIDCQYDGGAALTCEEAGCIEFFV